MKKNKTLKDIFYDLLLSFNFFSHLIFINLKKRLKEGAYASKNFFKGAKLFDLYKDSQNKYTIYDTFCGQKLFFR